MWQFAFPPRTASFPVSSRKSLVVFLYASHLCLSSTLLVSFLCPTALPAFLRFCCGRLQVLLVLQEEEREVRLQEGCPLSSTSASVVFRQMLEGLPLYTTPSSVLTRCSSMRSLLPSHTPIPRSFSRLWKGASTDSTNSSNFPRYGPPTAR